MKSNTSGMMLSESAVWFWFRIFVIFWAAYFLELPHTSEGANYFLSLEAYGCAWLATWLLSKAIDLCRAYRWRKQQQAR